MDSELITRVNFLDVAVHNVDEDFIKDIAKEILRGASFDQVVFLGLRDLLRARSSHKFGVCVQSARIVIPTSRLISRGIHFLLKKEVRHWTVFDFTIRLLGALEQLGGSCYLLGERQKHSDIIASNLSTSFPGLRLVGRYVGYYKPEIEKNILTAIKKAAPSLLLVGNGVKGKDLWIASNKSSFNPGIGLWSGTCFKIFSGRKSRHPDSLFVRFFTSLLTRPWRVFLVFAYLYYFILLLVRKISKR